MTQLTNAALDAILEPIGATTKRANVNLQIAGVDISNRYMDVINGSAAANTQIQSGGVDIGQLFAALGTAAVIQWAGAQVNVTHQNAAGGMSSASYTFNDDGATSFVGNTSTDPGQFLNLIGAGNASRFEVRYSKISGATFNGPAVGTFHDLAIARTWFLSSNAGGGAISGTGTITIREKLNTANFETRILLLSADSVNQGGGIFL